MSRSTGGTSTPPRPTRGRSCSIGIRRVRIHTRISSRASRRGRHDEELELTDTGLLDGNRFFDVVVTHAKAAPDDILIEITATNHGDAPAPLHLLPHVWLRNTWA